VGASTYWNPKGLPRAVMGLLLYESEGCVLHSGTHGYFSVMIYDAMYIGIGTIVSE
jgi:hypothetical protein